MKKENLINIVVGGVVLFGTVYLISKAWKMGQKDKKSTQITSPSVDINEAEFND